MLSAQVIEVVETKTNTENETEKIGISTEIEMRTESTSHLTNIVPAVVTMMIDLEAVIVNASIDIAGAVMHPKT
jgi:hypothetical protein